MTQNRVALVFTRGWGVYNKGDIAGFEADQAKSLIEGGVAVKAKDQPPAKGDFGTLKIEVQQTPELKELMDQITAGAADLEKREALLEGRLAELDARSGALDARADDLDRRAAAIAEREAELGAEVGETELVEPIEDAPKGKEASGLPKQGR